MTVRIALDCVGGDRAPRVVVLGAYRFWREFGDEASFLMFGDSGAITDILDSLPSAFANNVAVVHSEEYSEADLAAERPLTIIRRFERSSIRLSVDAMVAGDVDCIVSAGDAGVLFSTAKLFVRSAHGISRPGIVSSFPIANCKKSNIIVFDAGSNLGSDPINLMHFSVMGCAFSKVLLNKEDPKFALLSVSSEPSRGNDLVRRTHKMIMESFLEKNYIGCIGPDQIIESGCDVIVCDGFVGNIAIKTAESSYRLASGEFEEELRKSKINKIANLFVGDKLSKICASPKSHDLFGSVLVGLNGIVLRAQASSDEKLISSIIKFAYKAVIGRMNLKIEAEISRYEMDVAFSW